MFLKPLQAIIFSAALAALISVNAKGSEIYALGQTSTAGFSQGGGLGQTPRGWDFIVNSTGVKVDQLGVNAAIGDTIVLTLWDDSSQTELAQISVVSVANGWVFGNLGTSVLLTSGHEYSVIAWANEATNAWYLFNNTPPAAFNPTGVIQYVDTRFDNNIDQNTFPTGTIPSPAMYGVADIGYTLVAAPEPASIGMSAISLALLAFAVRARRA